VANVSHDGTFDAETGTIRWGIFLDGNSRTFSYTVTPPAAVAEIGRLRGIVSFDGSVRDITGADRVISVEGLSRLVRCETDANGVRLQLSGPAGQVGVLQRSSDLKDWEDVTTLFLPDGSVEYLDTDGTKETQNFYRLQIR
jgi:hypothetical protein